jgi:hypothetical protein
VIPYRMTEKQLKGRRVRVLSELRNGYAVVPVGAQGEVAGKFKGLAVVFDPCEHCGMRVRMHKIEPHNLALVDESAP